MNTDFDLAILGSGFAGSLMTMLARQCGRSVLLLERGRHPRFAIGESSTPLANLLLEEMSDAFNLPRLRPLSKWGTWQRAYPGIGCGLKRGFSFFHHQWTKEFAPDPKRDNQLLVAASAENDSADTHWYRPDFDHFLVREAIAAGAEYHDQTTLRGVTFGPNSAILDTERQDVFRRFRVQFVLDATGPRGALHRALNLPERTLPNLPGTQALFSHFSNVRRLAELQIPGEADLPPYPVDDAALHHVFPGGWIWVLRFNNGLTSAGVAATDECAARLRFNEGASAWRRLLEELPTVGEQFAHAQAAREFTYLPRLSFCSGQVAGPSWALLPSAAGFIDPLLSTGFTLTLLGIVRLAKALREEWHSPRFQKHLLEYSHHTREELLAVERLVAALYAHMGHFPAFAHLARLYFAPVSFAEITRRLGLGHLADSFLLHAHPEFGARARQCCAAALQLRRASSEESDLAAQVLTAIKPLDLIGLAEMSRRNWHGLVHEDLLQAAPKLGLTRSELEKRLMAHR